MYLTMKKSSNADIPGSKGGHKKPEKRPNSIVMEGRNEHCCGTACPKYVRPCPLIKLVIYVVYVAAH
jgi:hypothetical protein